MNLLANHPDVNIQTSESMLTLRCHLSFLPLQIQRAVCFKSVHPSQLTEAVQKRLFFLLRMRCQDLLGEAEFLISLSLLTVRRDGGRRDGETRDFSAFCTGDVLDDLCKAKDETLKQRQQTQVVQPAFP